MTIRPLNAIEEAFLRTNQVFPLCVVIVLRLRNAPGVGEVRNALDALQHRHLLLNADITKPGGRYVFSAMPERRPISCTHVERISGATWMEEANRSLNVQMGTEGPLMKAAYVFSEKDAEEGELVLSFHHSFVDSAALRLILHELLTLCAGQPLPEPDRPWQPGMQLDVPALERPFRGFRLFARLVPFVFRQLRREISFFRYGQSLPIPEHSENEIVNLRFSVPESRRLMLEAGKKGLSLNSVLNAAVLLNLIRYCHEKSSRGLYRSIVFADVRHQFVPPPPPDYFGCYISMLRFALEMHPERDLETLARELNRSIHTSSRKGELMLFMFLSKHLVRFSMAFRNSRLANAALSFMGELPLNEHYGKIGLADVHAYITNNKLGAEFSGFGKILFGRIELDFTYLTSEMDADKAEKIVTGIRNSLNSFIKFNEIN